MSVDDLVISGDVNNWTLHQRDPNLILYLRIPLDEGPVDLWIPRTTTKEEMLELVYPFMREAIQQRAEWTERSRAFYEQRAQRLKEHGMLLTSAGAGI